MASIAKIIEISASSKTGIEDAVKGGLAKAASSVQNITGAWVNGVKVVTDSKGKVSEWRVDLKVTFVLK